MSAGVETKIWLALKSRIDTLNINVPNYAFTKLWPAESAELPSSLAPFLRIGHIKADPIRFQVASNAPYERTGILSIVVGISLSQKQPMVVMEQFANNVADHFYDAMMTYQGVCVSIVDYPSVQTGYEDLGYWNTPVSIRWRTYA